MNPEEYERHRERVLSLSEHPLIGQCEGAADADPEELRQTTLTETEARHA